MDNQQIKSLFESMKIDVQLKKEQEKIRQEEVKKERLIQLEKMHLESVKFWKKKFTENPFLIFNLIKKEMELSNTNLIINRETRMEEDNSFLVIDDLTAVYKALCFVFNGILEIESQGNLNFQISLIRIYW